MRCKDVSPAAKAVQENHSNKQITLFTFTNETSYEYLLIFLKNSKKYIVTEQNVYVLQWKTKLWLSSGPEYKYMLTI